MKTLSLSAAVAALLAAPSLAATVSTEDHDGSMTKSEMKAQADYTIGQTFLNNDAFGGATVAASTLIGKFVFTTDTELKTGEVAEAGTEWNNIGEVHDIVMSLDGETQSILLDIGGFLGLGEHTVAVNMDELNLVRDSDDDGDFFIVVNTTKDALMKAPEYDFSKLGLFDAFDQADPDAAGMKHSGGMQEEASAAGSLQTPGAQATADINK